MDDMSGQWSKPQVIASTKLGMARCRLFLIECLMYIRTVINDDIALFRRVNKMMSSAHCGWASCKQTIIQM